MINHQQIFLRYMTQKSRFVILFSIAASLFACQNSQTTPTSVAQYSSPVSTGVAKPSPQLDTFLETSKEALLPDKPDSATELPRINIASEPENILNLTGFVVPKTAIFEMRLLNSGKTHLITHYSWQVIKLGIPLISEDQTIHESTGARLSYTFREKGRFRIIGTVRTSNHEVSSSSINVVGLT